MGASDLRTAETQALRVIADLADRRSEVDEQITNGGVLRSTVLDSEQPQLWINVVYMHCREAYEEAIALDSNCADT